MRAGRWPAAVAAVVGAVMLVAPAPAVQAARPDRVPAVTAASAGDPGAQGLGGVSVTVDSIVVGARLHLREWPLRPGTRVGIRIDVWVAPNAGAAKLALLEGDGVGLADCTGTTLHVGVVNRIRCTLVVPARAGHSITHVRISVCTNHARLTHSFLVLIAQPRIDDMSMHSSHA